MTLIVLVSHIDLDLNDIHSIDKLWIDTKADVSDFPSCFPSSEFEQNHIAAIPRILQLGWVCVFYLLLKSILYLYYIETSHILLSGLCGVIYF